MNKQTNKRTNKQTNNKQTKGTKNSAKITKLSEIKERKTIQTNKKTNYKEESTICKYNHHHEGACFRADWLKAQAEPQLESGQASTLASSSSLSSSSLPS